MIKEFTSREDYNIYLRTSNSMEFWGKEPMLDVQKSNCFNFMIVIKN